jgi:osmotically-inducible protein OsmY
MLLRAIFFPARLTYGVGKLSAKTGYKAGRGSVVGAYKAGSLLGYRRMLAVGVGVGIGLLVAPTSGQELRDSMRRRWEQRGGPDSDDVIAERVRHELSHSPRTWHLPQPAVEVVEGTAILIGASPHASGKDDIERTAAAVSGVTAVDNRLTVGDS